MCGAAYPWYMLCSLLLYSSFVYLILKVYDLLALLKAHQLSWLITAFNHNTSFPLWKIIIFMLSLDLLNILFALILTILSYFENWSDHHFLSSPLKSCLFFLLLFKQITIHNHVIWALFHPYHHNHIAKVHKINVFNFVDV